MSNHNYRFIRLTICISLLLLYSFPSCRKKTEFDELRQFVKNSIKIPIKQLNQKSCYLYASDSTELRDINIIHIIQIDGCTGCVVETAASMEGSGYEKKKKENIGEAFIIPKIRNK